MSVEVSWRWYSARSRCSSSFLGNAKTSFLSGDQWAYVAGIVAVGLGAALVFFAFPRKEDERRLLAEYQLQDTSSDASGIAS